MDSSGTVDSVDLKDSVAGVDLYGSVETTDFRDSVTGDELYVSMECVDLADSMVILALKGSVEHEAPSVVLSISEFR